MIKGKTKYHEAPRTLTLNGVDIAILTRAQMKEFGVAPEAAWSVGGGMYAYTGMMNRDQLFRAAGYDMNKIDFAVPQPWLEQGENLKRWKSGDRAAWYYAGKRGKAFGIPVWDTDAKRRLIRMIKARASRGR